MRLPEPQAKPHLLNEVKAHARERPVSLIYGAKDGQHNNAIVLLEALRGY